MNWPGILKSLIGRLWFDLFKDSDIVTGIEYSHQSSCKTKGNVLDSWLSGQVAGDHTYFRDLVPFVIYLDKAVIDPETDTGYVELIGHPIFDWGMQLDDSSSSTSIDFLSEDENAGYTVNLAYSVPAPFCITNHASKYTSILYKDIDYVYKDSHIVFCVNPEMLGFDEVKIKGSDGKVHTYLKAFGWRAPTTVSKDMVAAFESPELSDKLAEIAWDIHQNGATWLNSKQLLALASGSVICAEDGVIEHVWTEQGRYCVMVNGKVYVAPAPGIKPNFLRGAHDVDTVHGVDVKSGDVLFGTLKFFNFDESDSDSIPTTAQFPGMLVRTDVGEMVAYNLDESSSDSDGYCILPLHDPNGDSDNEAAYKNLCRSRIDNPGCPAIVVPSPVNPLKFICTNLRKGRQVLVALESDGDPSVPAALECIRRSMCAAGIMTVNVKAKSQVLNQGIETFTKPAGNAAVATYASLKVQELFASTGMRL